MKFLLPFLTFPIAVFVSGDLRAQHCPFDGSYAISIRIVQQTKTKTMPKFFLYEKDTARPETCRFVDRVDSIRFLTEKEIRDKMAEDPNSTRSRYLPEYLEKDYNFLKGNQTVFLNMASKDCMVERGNEYDLIPRNFVIRYTQNGQNVEVPLVEENIFSMCGAKGSWSRMKPVLLNL